MFEAYDIFAKHITLVNTEKDHWLKHISRNWDKVVRILVALSINLRCLICADLSLNYTAKSSLANHYRTVHRRRTKEFFLYNVATKDPDELEELLLE